MTDRIEQLLSDYWDAAYAEGCDGRIHDTDKGDAQKALSGIRAEFRTLRQRVKQGQKEGSPALVRFIECEGDKEPDPVERLRFFCSLAMRGQDWLDAEQFFDALKQQGEPAGVAGFVNEAYGIDWVSGVCSNIGDLIYTSAPTIPEGYQLIRSDLVAFLDGSGEIDGLAFEDTDTNKPRQRYWWRALLNDAPKPNETQTGFSAGDMADAQAKAAQVEHEECAKKAESLGADLAVLNHENAMQFAGKAIASALRMRGEVPK